MGVYLSRGRGWGRAYLIFPKLWPDKVIFDTLSPCKQQHRVEAVYQHKKLMPKFESQHRISKSGQKRVNMTKSTLYPLLSNTLPGDGRGRLFKGGRLF